MLLRDYGRIILSCPQRLAQRTSTRANASCGLAILAVGVHPVPYRTRKLSPHAPMVLQGQPCGRVGRRHPTSRIGSFFVCRQGRGAPLLAPKALHLTYISAKLIFHYLGFCEITYISTVEMYVICFKRRLLRGRNVVCRPDRNKRRLRARGPSERVSYPRCATVDISPSPLVRLFPGNAKRRAPRYGNALLRFTVLSSGVSPLPDVYACGFTRRWCRRQAYRRSEPSRCWRQRGCWNP